ncbi:MAG: MBL fold metallo-hydrolase [Candidatus Nanohaloarchaea archaeon]
MKVEVLGNVQDGGVPHLGCSCEVCEKAREDPKEAKYVGSLMLKQNSEEDSVRYLIDATPDVRFQIKGDYLDGIFTSHGHLGHIAGLLFFGMEALDSSDLPVYCTEKTEHFLRNNDPWRLLIDRGQVDVNQIEDGEEIDILGGCIEPVEVEHRYVNTDTVAFMIHGEEKKLFYLSDIDEWTENAEQAVESADIAIIDGTFWTKDEIERYEEVPHPPIKESMDRFEDLDTEVHFTHLNHTNPALREDSEEREELESRGFSVVEKGQEFHI